MNLASLNAVWCLAAGDNVEKVSLLTPFCLEFFVVIGAYKKVGLVSRKFIFKCFINFKSTVSEILECYFVDVPKD